MWKAARATLPARMAWQLCTGRGLRSLTTWSMHSRRTLPTAVNWRRSVATAARPSIPSISAAAGDGRFLTVSWQDGRESRFPFIYLRDNCTCTECFHELSQMRTVEIVAQAIGADIASSSVEAGPGGVTVSWPDGHRSVFSASWLDEHILSSKPKDRSQSRFQPPTPVPWTTATFPHHSVFELDSMMTDERVQYAVLENLYKYGVVVIKGCGTEVLPREVYDKLGWLQDSAFGPFWLVKPRPDPNNLAYSPKAFPLHTDLPFHKNTPGALLLHCLRQAPTGGHTYMTDGLAAAATLKEENPYLYDLLTRVPVTWNQMGYDTASDRHYCHELEQPILNVNAHGEITKVVFSVAARASYLSVEPDEVHSFYEGIIRWMQICRDNEHRCEKRLEPGEMLILNNQRIAHGRATIDDPRGEHGRCLNGCYLSWDSTDCRIRHLHNKLYKHA